MAERRSITSCALRKQPLPLAQAGSLSEDERLNLSYVR